MGTAKKTPKTPAITPPKAPPTPNDGLWENMDDETSKLLFKLTSQNWDFLRMMAEVFKDAAEDVPDMKDSDSLGYAKDNVTRATAAASSQNDLADALLVRLHRLGQLFIRFCPPRKEGRPKKGELFRERTVSIKNVEVNFDGVLRELRAKGVSHRSTRGIEFHLRQAGSLSSDHLDLWRRKQEASNKKPTFQGWLNEVEDVKKKKNLDRIVAKGKRAGQEMKKSGELARFRDWVKLEPCRFQDLAQTLKDKGEEMPLVDAIVTDPPYDRPFIDAKLFEKLAEFANEHLKPRAPLVIMVGQYWLWEIVAQLQAKGFWLRWIMACTYDTGECDVMEKRVHSNWKQILICHRKSEWEVDPHFKSMKKDWIKSGAQLEDYFHDWQQEPCVFRDIIELFAEPGDWICDPCAGWATTALACMTYEVKGNHAPMHFVGCEMLPDRYEAGLALAHLEWQRIFGGRERFQGRRKELPPSVQPKPKKAAKLKQG